MKDKLRQLLALILALSICFSLLSANAWATDEPEDVPTESTEVVTEKDKSEEKQEETPAETPSEDKQEEAPAETQNENKQEEAPAETQSENKQEETPAEAQSENKQEETPAETQSENKQEETPAEAQSEKKQEEEAPAQNEAETQPTKKKALGKMPGMGMTAYAATSHGITINTAQHGTVTASVNGSAATSAEEGATVTLTANPESGYRLKSISGVYKDYYNESMGIGSSTTGSSANFSFSAEQCNYNGCRLYQGKKITISSSTKTITRVVFTVSGNGNSRNESQLVTSSGTKTVSGTGAGSTITISNLSTNSVSLTGNGSNNAQQWQCNRVVVYGQDISDTTLKVNNTSDPNIRTFTMPAVVQGNVTITPVFEEIPKYNVTLNGGANAITSGGNTTQTGVTGAMTTVTYTANSGYHFTEFANITNNGITATRTSDTVVAVSGTPTADASITIPDAVADAVAVTGVTLNPSAAQTIDVDGKVSFTATVAPDNATDKKVKWNVGGTDTGAVKLYSDEACTTEVGADAIETLTVYAKGISAGSATVTATSNADSEKKASCDVTVNAAQTQTETLLTTITATGKEQASYSTENVATVSFSYTANGYSSYTNNGKVNWGWWGYGWSATVNAAEGYTITKCVFYDDKDRTATDSEAPFVVETTEEDKTPKVNGTPILANTSKGITKIEVYGYATPAATHSVTITPGSNMTKTAGSGDAEQTGLSGAMTDVVYTANDGYKFPETNDAYTTTNGITVAVSQDLKTITVSGTPTANTEITIPDAVEDTASDDPYAELLNTTTAVNFDGKEWYLIENNSTAANAGTVTLLSKECVAASQYNSSGSYVEYASSTVKTAVDNWYNNNITSNAKTAVFDNKMFLLTKDQAGALTTEQRKCSQASGAAGNYWWLRSPGISDNIAACVYGGNGGVLAYGLSVNSTYGVRPALKLNLSSVIFSSESNTFTVGSAASYSVIVTAGSNMTKTETSGAASQTDLSGTMTDVVYTADDGYYFPTDYSVAAVNGITVTRDSFTQITVSGNPTADAEITLPAPTQKTTPDAPTTAAATGCTTADNNDGKLTGVTTAMEYKKSDVESWLPGSENGEITGLVPGTYYVRIKATDTANASANQELTIKGFIAYTVTFKVVNGKWDDETTEDKTVTLTGYEGDTLKLAANQIPAVGTKPNDTYKAGSWDRTPSTETAITEATTYTYTYAAKEASVVTKAPEAKTLTYNGSAQELVTAGEATGGEMQYALGDANGATQPYTTSIPTATNTGTYYVWYKVVGDANHNSTEPNSVEAKINPVDKTDLNTAIEEAEAYYESIKEDDVYAQVAEALKKAIDEAKKYTNDNVAEKEVKEAIDTIKAAKVDAEEGKKETDDTEATKKVTDAINALPASDKIATTDKEAIEAVRKAYDALTADQKKKVSADTLKKLTDAETALKTAQKDAADKTEADKAIEAINKLPASDKVATTDKAAIEAARKAYDALSADQKKQVPADTLKKLTDAEKALKTAEANDKAAKELATAKAEAQAAMNEQVTVTQKGNKFTVKWKKSSVADGYYVYAGYCGKKATKPVKTIKKNTSTKTTITKIDGKKISTKKNFHVYVVPYKIIDGKKVTLGKSTVAHLVGTKSTKYSNVKTLTLTKKKYTVKVGKTAKVKAKVTLVNKNKKHIPKSHGAKFRYKSSDTSIATVSKNGTIKGIKKGTCTIYVYSINGLVKKAKVTVK